MPSRARRRQLVTADGLLGACERFLGPVTVLSDMSWPLGSNNVVEVMDGQGRSWIAKTVGHQESYERELHALRYWAPALGPGAPVLHAFDNDMRLLIMTRLAGRRAEDIPAETDPAVHRQAGQLTRRLHDAEPPVLNHDIGAATVQKLEIWISRAGHLLGEADISFSREQVRPLAALGRVPTVPCHMDNQPRNWLVDDEGTVRLMDFGASKRDVWIRDLGRLYVQQWLDRPDLRAAFFAGYGRSPTDDDHALLRCYLSYSALATTVWAHENGDPGFEAQGRRTLARLRAGSLTVS